MLNAILLNNCSLVQLDDNSSDRPQVNMSALELTTLEYAISRSASL